MSISAQNVSKRFGDFVALDDVTVECPAGELVALLGPSGSGKTTLLRVIAGLEVPDSGTVHFRDDDITRHSARDRNVGFVFQHYALFRHMTVFENVAFGLRVRKWPEAKARERVRELLRLVRLEEKAELYPANLSGGQKQRIALVRALAPEPKVLLLKGRVEQEGSPTYVFEHPRNEFVMDFLGNVNKLPVRVEGGRALLGETGTVELPAKVFASRENGRTDAYIRPHELDLSRTADGGNCLLGRVVHINPAGSVVKVRLLAEDFGLMINVDITPDRYRALALRQNEAVFVTPKSARIFEAEYNI